MTEVLLLHDTPLHLGTLRLAAISLPGDSRHSTVLLHALIDDITNIREQDWGFLYFIFI